MYYVVAVADSFCTCVAYLLRFFKKERHDESEQEVEGLLEVYTYEYPIILCYIYTLHIAHTSVIIIVDEKRYT
jgi:hypothetical protein